MPTDRSNRYCCFPSSVSRCRWRLPDGSRPDRSRRGPRFGSLLTCRRRCAGRRDFKKSEGGIARQYRCSHGRSP
jgi:hypothetical protein